MIVFHALIGNTDGHIKNFSLIYDRTLRSVKLAPAYDIVSTVLYDTHSSEMAFSVGGEIEWNKLSRACFEEACKEIGLSKKLFMSEFDRMAEYFGRALREAAGSMEAEGFNNISKMAEKIIEKGGSLCHM